MTSFGHDNEQQLFTEKHSSPANVSDSCDYFGFMTMTNWSKAQGVTLAELREQFLEES
jgi:hypothetical protein